MKKLTMFIREAFANLVTAKLRSFLAILGILVGTASVVALITSSQLATEHALSQFKTLGTNLIAMDFYESTGQPQEAEQKTQQLSLQNIPQIKNSSPQITLVAPYVNLFQTISFEGEQKDGQVLGATDDLADIVKIKIARGRFISYLDRRNFYCVIGSDIAQEFADHGISNPIGKQILVGPRLFTIIGIAEPWQPNWFLFAEINKGVIIPLGTSYMLSNYAKISNILFRLSPNADLNAVQKSLETTMESLLPGQKITFRNPQQVIDIMVKQQATFTWLLGAIGGISLLVGGIGVMNIMLVSVVERRREIGIRMAIGARRADIRRMFLIEAIILTLAGGVIGIVIGIVISMILALVTGWEFHLLIFPPLLGFCVSVAVGIISGYYPAFRASNLDPIETLRGE